MQGLKCEPAQNDQLETTMAKLAMPFVIGRESHVAMTFVKPEQTLASMRAVGYCRTDDAKPNTRNRTMFKVNDRVQLNHRYYASCKATGDNIADILAAEMAMTGTVVVAEHPDQVLVKWDQPSPKFNGKATISEACGTRYLQHIEGR